jgi:Ran GTPase-activating protein (RanGAP) involved in mRNA processing and transport
MHNLTQINLSYNDIGYGGLRSLGSILARLQELTSLNLESNRLEFIEGARTLKPILQMMPNLTSLNLSQNLIAVK